MPAKKRVAGARSVWPSVLRPRLPKIRRRRRQRPRPEKNWRRTPPVSTPRRAQPQQREKNRRRTPPVNTPRRVQPQHRQEQCGQHVPCR